MSYRQPVAMRGKPVLASLLAGPFCLFRGAMTAIWPGWDSGGDPIALVFASPIAVIVGFVVSVIPNLGCTAILRLMGRQDGFLRHPAAWAMIGALLPGMPAAIAGGGSIVTLILAATGASCALTCRIGVTWDD